ncbi:unnamed protein product [Pedinophyceae sp. YPF-701]|nr:unnamed protein product [Pedinophyceae sp. YPF-701]
MLAGAARGLAARRRQHAAALVRERLVPTALCDALPNGAPGNRAYREGGPLRAWLAAYGANIEHVEFREICRPAGAGDGAAASPQDVERGVFPRPSLFLARRALGLAAGVAAWAGMVLPLGIHGDVEVASFPTKLALTAQAAREDPHIGQVLTELHETGIVDDETTLVLYLTAHKVAGEASRLLPYLSSLPDRTPTPLWLPPDQLDAWLAGTNAHKATKALQGHLLQLWPKVQPVVRQMAMAVGGAGVPEPGFGDFVWAHSMFWSRSVELPSGPDGAPQSALVPGLDMFNHAPGAPFRYEPKAGSVAVVAPWSALRALGRAGGDGELTIDYGRAVKSNEELLFHYGIVEAAAGPADVVALLCPLPPRAEWDDRLEAQAACMYVAGGSPRILLPPLDARQTARRDPARKGSVLSRAGRPGALKELLAAVPHDGMVGLRAFATPGIEAAAIAEAGKDPEWGPADTWDAGTQLSVVTTLARLLETRIVDLEGPEGTGPLEHDIGLLEGSAADAHPLEPLEEACAMYRAQQKRLTREWAVLARAAVAELSGTMAARAPPSRGGARTQQ